MRREVVGGILGHSENERGGTIDLLRVKWLWGGVQWYLLCED